ncbi:MAG: DUF58 domain-containing protein [Pseudomonadota bacterium]
MRDWSVDQRDIRLEAEQEAASWPALMLEAQRIAQTVAAGLHGRRRAGPGESFWQHRPYAFGDPVGAIDWRQSARAADRLYVRQNEWDTAAALYFWRDPSASLAFSSGAQTPSKRRRADILATALAILLSKGGERIAMLGGGRRPFQGRTAPEKLLEELLRATNSNDEVSAPPRDELPAGAQALLISDFFSGGTILEERVGELARQGVKGVLLQVCDPAEEDFPFEGRVEFSNMGASERLLFGDVSTVRGDYKKRFSSHRDALAALAGAVGWTFLSHRTDRAPQTALLALIAALGDGREWTG